MMNYEQWSEVVTGSLTTLSQKFLGFFPNLIGAFLILVIGWIISKTLEVGLSRFFRMVGVNKLAEKTNISSALQTANIQKTVSEILARILYWVLFLVFFTSALETLGLSAVSESLYGLIAYIPNIFAAALIVLLGSVIAGFLRDVIIAGSASANIGYGKILGKAGYTVAMIFISVVALSQIGLDTTIITANITLIIAGIVATAVLSFGLSGKGVAKNILASHYIQTEISKGDTVVIGETEGKVESVSATFVTLKKGSENIIIPNATVLENGIIKK